MYTASGFNKTLIQDLRISSAALIDY